LHREKLSHLLHVFIWIAASVHARHIADPEVYMSIARVVEITATSQESFEDALEQGVARATQTLRNVRSAWVKEQEVQIENGEISGYKVNMLVTFVLDDNAELDDTGERGSGGARGRGRKSAGRRGRG
jgi:dodecin